MPGGNSCAFRGCVTRSGAGLSMFSFPKDPEQAKLWINACYRDDLLPKAEVIHKSWYRMCELHFEEKFMSKGNSKKCLFANVIPTIFPTKMVKKRPEKHPEERASEDSPNNRKQNLLVPQENEIIHILVESSTSAGTQLPGLGRTANMPRKRKLKATINSHRKRSHLSIMDKFKKMYNAILENPLNEIIKAHITLQKNKRISLRYALEMKQSALKLYFLSPRAYKFVCKLLTLPTKRSLDRMAEHILCKPDLQSHTIFVGPGLVWST